jgi:signal recognition particle subunit SEC65
MTLTKDEYRDRIISHKLSVKTGIQRIVDELESRAEKHDDDKLYPRILENFMNVSNKFSGVKFASTEYNEILNELKPVLNEHYEKSPHHPEHNINGINGMTLIDLIEMLVDWKSASTAYGDTFYESLKITKERFNIGEQLFEILLNTSKELGYLPKGEN